jgi:Lectin C-type domain
MTSVQGSFINRGQIVANRTRRRTKTSYRKQIGHFELLERRELLAIDVGPFVNPANGHTYYRLTPSTWTAAEDEAVKLGGHLVTINDAEENKWVSDIFGDPKQWGLWIGLNDVVSEGQFVWSSGEIAGYRNWSPTYAQPDNFNYGHSDEDYVLLWNPLIGAGNSGWAWADYLDWAYATPPNSYPSQGVVEVPTALPDLAAKSLTINNGNVNYEWKIDGADLTVDPSVQLVWSDNATYEPSIDTDVANTIDTAGKRVVGTYPGSVAVSALSETPKNYLLLVTDPANSVNESDESHASNVKAFNRVDIVLQDAKLRSATSVGFNYDVIGTISQPITASLYASDEPNLYPLAGLWLGSTVVAPTPQATGEITFNPDFWPRSSLPHLKVVIDPVSPLQPRGEILETDDLINNFKVIKSTDIAMVDATTTDFQNIELKYTIANFPADPFILRAYVSDDEKFDPGVDIEVGELRGKGRQPESDGRPKEYYDTLRLRNAQLPTLTKRFLVIQADADQVVQEVDEANNGLFVIPLFLEQQGRSGGGFDANGDFVWRPTGSDFDFVSEVTHRVFNMSTAHSLNLTDPMVTTAIWQSAGGFKNEEFNDSSNKSFFPEFRDDDARINRGLVAPLTELVRLITRSRDQDRLTSTIRITEAFDQNGEHMTSPRKKNLYTL